MSYNVLSRLKGIETDSNTARTNNRKAAYNVLSRLKGIETPSRALTLSLQRLTMSFPV